MKYSSFSHKNEVCIDIFKSSKQIKETSSIHQFFPEFRIKGKSRLASTLGDF